MDSFNFSCSVQKYFSGESRRVRATLAELISVYATTLNNSRRLLPGPATSLMLDSIGGRISGILSDNSASESLNRLQGVSTACSSWHSIVA